jgi:hypothetical protein
LAPERLRVFIKRYGTELAKQHLESLVAGPYHGVPDDLEARAAAEGVAEVDALVLAERQGEATRRYRELTGTTWDQAVDVIHGWHNLERAKKLALCGWCPKDSPQAKDSEVRDHPMLDHRLDG